MSHQVALLREQTRAVLQWLSQEELTSGGVHDKRRGNPSKQVADVKRA